MRRLLVALMILLLPLRGWIGDVMAMELMQPALQAVHLEVLRGEAGALPVPGARVRTNLRAQLTSFVGRADEVKRVRQTLEHYRLVTLVGPGGAGKTRLAAEVAADVRDNMAADEPDGIWIVELASVTDAADVPKAVLDTIGLRESQRLPDSSGTQRVTSRDARTRLLEGLADASALLVLDNCEHLIDACAHLADALLASSPRLRIIATSREPLGITGESLLVVPPLREEPAVHLFADRAAAVSPDFTLDGVTRPLVADIVTRLDGLPLAIELAAARLRTLPLAEVSRRLADRFRLLTGGSRTALPRHRTLRAVVEWSWELLDPAERLLAERFSVFPAGATVAAVTAVCADREADKEADREADKEARGLAAEETDELLSSLVDKSLLQPLADGTRLRMLETIREYGAEQLAGRGEVAGLRRRHAAYYSALMREAAPRLLTRDQLTWLAQLQADRGNILAALRYWCDTEDANNALSLGVSLSVMAFLLGYDADVAEWISEAVAVPGEADPDVRTIAEAIHMVTCVIAPVTGAAATVSPELTERLDALDIEKYPISGLLRPLYALFTKDDARVRGYLDQARAGRDEWLVAVSWMLSASLAENNGDLDEMRAASAEAVRLFRALGERWGLSSALRSVGTIGLFDGDLAAAIAAYTESSDLLAELGAREDLSQAQLQLAELALRQGDFAKARELSKTARATAEATGSAIDRGIAAAWWAAFEVRSGNREAARPFQAAAEQHLARFSAVHPAREHLEAMIAAIGSQLAIADNDMKAAREQAARAYRAAVGTNDMPVIAQVCGAVAELALELGEPERAAELLGAGAAVRGADDPTDPMILQLAPRLRAVLGDEGYDRAYRDGKALDRQSAIERLDPSRLHQVRRM